MLKIRVPATTANLGPGFDCLGMAIDIYNTVEIGQSTGAPLTLDIFGSAADDSIPVDDTNLVYKAAAHVFNLAGKPADGIHLKLGLESPLARGLGSSASAICGGMFAANEILGKPLSTEALAWEVTVMEGHPDNVIPCLVGGLTVSLSLEDRVIYDRFEPASNIECVFFIPDYELETSKARAVMPHSVSMKDAVFNSSRIPFVLTRLQSGQLRDLDKITDDRLHQPYRTPLIAGYDEVKNAAMEAGAATVCISGAGPTILAICDAAVADKVMIAGKSALENLGIKVDARIAKPDMSGCRVES